MVRLFASIFPSLALPLSLANQNTQTSTPMFVFMYAGLDPQKTNKLCLLYIPLQGRCGGHIDYIIRAAKLMWSVIICVFISR